PSRRAFSVTTPASLRRSSWRSRSARLSCRAIRLRQASRRTPLRVLPAMVGQPVGRSRWTGRSTVPRAVPAPGWTEAWAYRPSRAPATGETVTSGIGPHSWQGEAPALRDAVALGRFLVGAQGARGRVGVALDEVDSAGRDGEARRVRPVAVNVPAG